MTTEIAPSSSPAYRTGNARSRSGKSNRSGSSIGTDSREPFDGHEAAGRSPDPTRIHTRACVAPMPSARILAILGSTSSVE